MELKKSVSANLEDKRLTYVLVGLVIALSVIYVAFEWTESDIVVAEITQDLVNDAEEEIEIEQTLQEETPPPEPEEIPEEVIEEVVVVDNEKKVETINVSSEDDSKTKVVVTQAPVVEVEEEDEEQIFQVVEVQPSFPGGNEGIAKYFRENMKYPLMAQEMGIQGKVVCQFTVRKDGSVGDIVVLRSADKSLDAEAIRLISKMPKWNPGKQRGKPVHCKFTVPITFKLNH